MLTHFMTGFAACQGLIVAIGAQNSFVLRQGIQRQHVLTIVLICAVSDALLISAGIAGMGALIERCPLLLQFSRYGGAAFLLAYGGFAARRAWQTEQLALDPTRQLTLGAAVATCLGLTYLNPHVYLDTVLLLGTLANQHPASGKWLFGAGAIASSVIWFFALAYGARFLAPLFRKPQAWRVLDGGIALLMWTLTANLLRG